MKSSGGRFGVFPPMFSCYSPEQIESVILDNILVSHHNSSISPHHPTRFSSSTCWVQTFSFPLLLFLFCLQHDCKMMMCSFVGCTRPRQACHVHLWAMCDMRGAVDANVLWQTVRCLHSCSIVICWEWPPLFGRWRFLRLGWSLTLSNQLVAVHVALKQEDWTCAGVSVWGMLCQCPNIQPIFTPDVWAPTLHTHPMQAMFGSLTEPA